jgi:recombining binding protein (suppressor of hairless)
MWLVDPSAHDRPHPPLSGREAWEGYPPPPDALPLSETIPLVICYNNIIRLQCPTTGLTSPVMVLRRVDHGQTAYGNENIRREGPQGKCPVGEYSGEPVSQLHKVCRMIAGFDDYISQG